jgi:hypothetical protein
VALNPRGPYAAMAVHALNGRLGSIDVEGGLWRSPSGPPLAAYPKTDAFVDELAKDKRYGKRLDDRGTKDMPAMVTAEPGRGVITNNGVNGMRKDPEVARSWLARRRRHA